MPSGPVFVLDALAQPLMPLAEAHARKLLRSGKAHRLPHPTLTIIQLTRTVQQPVLRPVLLGVAIHHTTAELLLLAAGPNAAFPLLYVIVDLPQRKPFWRRRVVHRRQRMPWPARWQHSRRPAWRKFLAIGAVISCLWDVLPLSHIALIRTPTMRATHPDIQRRVLRYLTAGGMQVATTTLEQAAPPTFPQDLFALLRAFAANPAGYAPAMVACAIEPPKHATRLTRWLDDADAGAPCSGIGVVTTPPLIGIIDCESTDDERVLQVSVAADAAGVIWRYVAVAPQASLQRWPLAPVVLLPLVPRTVQQTVTLLEDRWDA
jgi:RRXRR protein